MNKLVAAGRIIFAIGIAGLGIVCFIMKDFIVGRPHAWPANFDINPALAYISGSFLVLASMLVIVRWKPVAAALLIAAMIFVLSVLRDLPFIMNDWLNSSKALALVGGALIIAASFYREQYPLPPTGDRLRRVLITTGSVLLAIFFVAGGYAHFKYAEFVTNFIPSYIPFRSFWAYFCGICLIAGGIGILIPGTRRLAALLSAVMLSGWFLLLHIPRFVANPGDASDRMGLCESFAFAGIFFALAGIISQDAIKHLPASVSSKPPVL